MPKNHIRIFFFLRCVGFLLLDDLVVLYYLFFFTNFTKLNS